MIKWPRSGWSQAGIAFAGALLAAILVYGYINKTHFDLYARQYPHDGQDGLGAMMDALSAGAMTMLVTFVVLFFVQRIATKR